MRRREAQALLLGHADVKTTMIFTHVLEQTGGRGVRSPIDALTLDGATKEGRRATPQISCVPRSPSPARYAAASAAYRARRDRHPF